MQIKQEHIDQLYKFTRQHYVEWYDLQTELVDHLANDIEQIWDENPDLSFDEAKNLSFKKFGIFGFSDIIGQKRNALTKKYWLLVWKYFKEYFNLPKIILTVLLIGITYTLLHMISNKEAFLFIFFGIAYFFISVFLLRNHKKNKLLVKQTNKKWLFQECITNMGGIMAFWGLPVSIYSLAVDETNWSELNITITTIVMILTGLFVYILTRVIPSRMEEIMRKQYPEYNLYSKIK